MTHLWIVWLGKWNIYYLRAKEYNKDKISRSCKELFKMHLTCKIFLHLSDILMDIILNRRWSGILSQLFCRGLTSIESFISVELYVLVKNYPIDLKCFFGGQLWNLELMPISALINFVRVIRRISRYSLLQSAILTVTSRRRTIARQAWLVANCCILFIVGLEWARKRHSIKIEGDTVNSLLFD